jgi:hypothetical protein
MNTDYAHENGYVTIPGNFAKGLEISKWCREKGWIHNQDYKWHCFQGEVRMQFKDPKHSMLVGLTWG